AAPATRRKRRRRGGGGGAEAWPPPGPSPELQSCVQGGASMIIIKRISFQSTRKHFR
ncbi:hypothetical protein EE612_055623, partial [Oryza sativa]